MIDDNYISGYYDTIGFQEPVCLICGGLLNDYSECKRCSSLENEEIW